MIDVLSDFVPNVHFELIPIKDLVSNQEYQRNLSWTHVKKAVDNFDLNQINPIKVSRRDGVNYVFNGQHTAEIVAAVSGSRNTPVWCMVYDDLDYEREADIFANQMKNVKPLSPYDVFNGHCQAGNDKELMINALVESYDLTLSFYVQRYFISHLIGRHNYGKNTVSSYRDTFKLLQLFLNEHGRRKKNLLLSEVDKDCVVRFLEWLDSTRGNSPATRNVRLAHLKSFQRLPFDYEFPFISPIYHN